MEKLFDFLDVDKSGKISKDEVDAGLSYVLNRDIPSEDVNDFLYYNSLIYASKILMIPKLPY